MAILCTVFKLIARENKLDILTFLALRKKKMALKTNEENR